MRTFRLPSSRLLGSRVLRSARHILVHVYWGIDREQVWKMAVEDGPVFTAAVELALEGWQPHATTGEAASESPD